MNDKIVVDPILESVCLPLVQDEFDLLEKQILRDGCQDTLKVWDRDGECILLDGHNRLKICETHNLPYDTSTIEIDSIDEAIVWIVDNQKGRRNIATDEQLDYISGKRREAQKNINRARSANGVFKSNAPSALKLRMDEGDIKANQCVALLVQAHDEGVSHFKIQSNEKFAAGVDAIREVSPSLAEKILKHDEYEPMLTKKAVMAIPKLKKALSNEPHKFEKAIKAIEDAIGTEDKKAIEIVVRDHISPNEPTHEEKMIAKKHNLKPEHVRYANEHNIPIKSLKTVDQLERQNEQKKRACSTIWDGFYKCSCGIKFEIFGAIHAPVVCPHCESKDLKRDHGV